ncbi:carbohydrate sulfotransferase 11-like [Latimeria chalumnae]|uniref:carbohydrate sulfotransferase 11-like n=1 Tax=Latimeria chalumnae TaxID=7897 RepID=UPI00313BD6DE
MRLPFRVLLVFLGIGYFLWWRRMVANYFAPEQAVHLSAKTNFSLTFDMFHHAQRLRKSRLKKYCSKRPKEERLDPGSLSGIMVNEQLQLMFCAVPDAITQSWRNLLEVLESLDVLLKEEPALEYQAETPYHSMGERNLSSIKGLLSFYTKVLFMREPFQRLVSAYHRHFKEEMTFKEFAQSVASRRLAKANSSWEPLSSLCHLCRIDYDYLLVYSFLDKEVGFMMKRMGVPQEEALLEFEDAEAQWTSSSLVERCFSELSHQQQKQLVQLYRTDFAAFKFSNSLLWKANK